MWNFTCHFETLCTRAACAVVDVLPDGVQLFIHVDVKFIWKNVLSNSEVVKLCLMFH